MQRLKVKVIGCGGVGGCLLNVLPRYLNYLQDYRIELTLIDGDNYEDTNRTRQNVTGRGNKAELSAEKIRAEFDRVFCVTTAAYVGPENVSMLVRDGDVVFCCVDNHATRKLLSDQCEKLRNVTLISGGNEYTDGNIQIHVRKDGVNQTLPVANKYHKEIQQPNDKIPSAPSEEVASCQVRAVSSPQLLAMNNLVAAHMFAAFTGLQRGVFDTADKCYDEVYLDLDLNKASPKKRN